ncbi:nitrate/nitrite transporter NrtS [Winogradskyella psychrotolerans]|uniref:nitrate/nitrite transporter NrtS n=1 Tax=Winogradskyella psychrotolerans TaxID=1344585 RepID=UPI0034DB39B5
MVGCILNIINQGELLYHLNFENVNWLKLSLCFVVPYSVSTYASVKVKTERN